MKVFFKIFMNVIKNNRKQTLMCFIIMFAMSLLQVAIPLTMKNMVTQIETFETVEVFLLCIVIYAAMWLCYSFINIKWYKHIDLLGERVLWYIREKIYDIIWNCKYDNDHNNNADYLKNVLFTDVIGIYGNIIMYSLNIIADTFMILIFLGVSFYVDVPTTIILLAAVAVGLAFSVITRPIISRNSMKINEALKKDNAVNNECVDAVNVIRANGLITYYKDKVRRSIHNFIGIAVKTDQKTMFLQNLVNNYHQILIMFITGFLILKSSSISTGNLVYYIFVTNLIIEKSQSIEDNLFRFMKNIASFDNIDKIIGLETPEEEKLMDAPVISTIQFSRVGLKYDGVTNIFENISFSLSKGDAVLIEGINGSGKSSLLKLMAGIISPTEGNISYNNLSYKAIDRQTLYRSICYLSQEELLLNGTFQEYLSAVAHKPITEKQLKEYFDKIDYSNNSDMITDNGRHFSGGEKKKAIIMKLLARKDDVSVVLLDETESGLDVQSKNLLNHIETEILQNRDKYIFVKISHNNVDNKHLYNKIIKL